ncbi:RNA polymerase sigma factor [Actinomadura chibensis]|uniref:Sigma-70 family RNA polymerase sigma factor n=1 Tax=Actinomadura chibensis TaxID=392828 RepID=A0A5D0NTV5_9ACTN|nr:sigma-70 family RNA polymerase sigma factor [Actinomadura chibensis]TYB47797.1 sigma-70 family RNA polymerase sigma factor [Actinomadura chibensis]
MRDEEHDDGRLKADQQLVEFLAEHGFAGPVYREFAEELAGQGMAVISAWLGSELIFVKCAEKGIRLPRPPTGWSQDDRLELTLETVARALRAFRTGLVEDRWDVERGASLRTYFIGACIYQFSRTYRVWLRSLAPECEQPGDIDEWRLEGVPGPEDVVADRDAIRRGLQDIDSVTVRAAVVLAAEGYSRAEIAELIGGGLTARAVEGLLYRHRRRTQGGDR